MKTHVSLVAAILFLAACGGANVDEPAPPPQTDASPAVDARTSDASSCDAVDPMTIKPGDTCDPYKYACCSFANEGLSEYDECCATWRAEHDGKDSL